MGTGPGRPARAAAGLHPRRRAGPGERVNRKRAVCFDSSQLQRDRVLAALADVDALPPASGGADSRRDEPSPGPSAVVRPDAGGHGRARIAVSGLDRDPQLARRVEERLEARPEVRRAEASPITGRVLVEFSRRVTDLDDVLNEVAKLELAPRPGEDRPEHPLDPGPLVHARRG